MAEPEFACGKGPNQPAASDDSECNLSARDRVRCKGRVENETESGDTLTEWHRAHEVVICIVSRKDWFGGSGQSLFDSSGCVAQVGPKMLQTIENQCR